MTEKPQSEQSLDSRFDEAVDMTFPASDRLYAHALPPEVNRGSRKQVNPRYRWRMRGCNRVRSPKLERVAAAK
jgi:hypothetical protein